MCANSSNNGDNITTIKTNCISVINSLYTPLQSYLCILRPNLLAVHILPQGDGPECKAVFALLSSPVCNLKFANFGARLAVGFECGQVRITPLVSFATVLMSLCLQYGLGFTFSLVFQVAVLDISTSSLLFVTDSLSNSSSPVIYLAVKSFSVTESLTKSTEDSDINTSNDSVRELVFFMTKDAYIVVCDSITGFILASQSIHPKESNAISMYILGKYFLLER